MFYKVIKKGNALLKEKYMFLSCGKVFNLPFMHLSAAIRGGGGGGTPGTYGRIARDLLTFVAIFLLGTGALDRFCTSIPMQDLRDLEHRHLENKRSRPRGLGIVSTGRSK